MTEYIRELWEEREIPEINIFDNFSSSCKKRHQIYGRFDTDNIVFVSTLI